MTHKFAPIFCSSLLFLAALTGNATEPDHPNIVFILADDMGLGKTLQGLTLLWTLLKQGSEVRPEGWNKKHTSFFLTDSLSLSFFRSWAGSPS